MGLLDTLFGKKKSQAAVGVNVLDDIVGPPRAVPKRRPIRREGVEAVAGVALVLVGARMANDVGGPESRLGLGFVLMFGGLIVVIVGWTHAIDRFTKGDAGPIGTTVALVTFGFIGLVVLASLMAGLWLAVTNFEWPGDDSPASTYVNDPSRPAYNAPAYDGETDCSDVGGPVNVLSDPNDLDRDNDGVGCEAP